MDHFVVLFNFSEKKWKSDPYKSSRCYTMAKTRQSRVPVDDL